MNPPTYNSACTHACSLLVAHSKGMHAQAYTARTMRRSSSYPLKEHTRSACTHTRAHDLLHSQKTCTHKHTLRAPCDAAVAVHWRGTPGPVLAPEAPPQARPAAGPRPPARAAPVPAQQWGTCRNRGKRGCSLAVASTCVNEVPCAQQRSLRKGPA